MIHPKPATHWLRLLLGSATALTLALAALGPLRSAGAATTMPEFAHTTPDAWINSPPLTKAGLRGKVVLLEVYTSG